MARASGAFYSNRNYVGISHSVLHMKTANERLGEMLEVEYLARFTSAFRTAMRRGTLSRGLGAICLKEDKEGAPTLGATSVATASVAGDVAGMSESQVASHIAASASQASPADTSPGDHVHSANEPIDADDPAEQEPAGPV